MRVDLSRLRREPLSWSEELTVPLQSLQTAELVGLSPLRCRGRVNFVDPGFLVVGEVTYEQTLTCFRCLGPVAESVLARLELLVLVEAGEGGDEPEGPERELEEQDLHLVKLAGEELDTEPLILEQVHLNLPMKPLCAEDCRGLCPTCGGNRNEVDCGCQRQETDPRWASLAALRRQLPSS